MRTQACRRLRVPALVTIGLAVALHGSASGQLLGMSNARSHPELEWMQIETEHFLIIYSRGLEDVAARTAVVAEQVYGPVTRGLEIDMPGRTSILLTAEDETVNGFALPGGMYVWVNVNDFVARFGSEEKWLRLVIAHEFQHVVWMQAARDWTGLWPLLRTPAWFIEGMAEHCTEEWGAYRSDLQLRSHVLRGRQRDLDPHDSGFSKVRYLASQYGDSVLVRAVRERGTLGLADFGGGFRRTTGVSLRDFDEEWRRAVSAYTYALFGQKEPIADAGTHIESPLPRLQTLTYAPDGKHIAGLVRPAEGPAQLIVASTDSTHTRRLVDHGALDTAFAFSPDGSALVYAKMHRSTHGSLLWDLKVADLGRGKTRWITSARRASHPHWSPVENRIVFTAADGSTTNLYTCAPDGSDVEALTHHADDVQVLGPRFSPDGTQLAFSRFEPGQGLDLVVMQVSTRTTRRVTRGPARDVRPLWSRDGTRLFFSSERNRDEVPNVFTVPARGGEDDVECLTDVGEALFALDVQPDSGFVVAVAMATTDSMRLRRIDPERRARVVEPRVDARFTAWRDAEPAHPIPPIDWSLAPATSSPRPYRAWRHPRSMGWLVLPSPDLWGLMAAGFWVDAALHHSVLLAGDAGTKDDSFGLRWLYGRWDTNQMPFGLGGFLRLSGGIESRVGMRLYAGELLVDTRDHFTASWRLPLNAGEHLYANHEVEALLDFADVRVREPDDFGSLTDDDLPQPLRAYQEAKLEGLYRYRKFRPQQEPGDHPRNGHGMLLRFEWATEALGSDVEFRRTTVDASKAWGLPLLGTSAFARVQGQAVWGTPAPQDFTGLRADPALLPLRYTTTYVIDDVLTIADAMALRGYPHNVPGEQALATTIEWRLPLTPPLPVSAFGFTLGGLSGVLFYDHGRVWDADAANLARHTMGWELRLPLRFGRRAFLVPSYGEGQTLEWEDASFERDEYFRIAMVRAF